MRNVLEHLLRSVDLANPASVQQRWEDYRAGADSPDPTIRVEADAAFSTLIAWHGRTIYRHIWGFIRSDAADDVFQDVLRKLHLHRNDPRLASFNEEVLPWIRRVAIHQCLDVHRETKRRQIREVKFARAELADQSLPRTELNDSIAEALAQLPEKLQQAIALHYFEGLTRQEAATLLGIHRDTLTARIRAALELLRNRIPFNSLAIGGTLVLTSALAAEPPPLTHAKLEQLVSGTAATFAPAGWSAKSLLALALAGLTIAGGVTIAVRSSMRLNDPHPALERPKATDDETLQDRNLRLARERVIPELMRLGEKLFPAEFALKEHAIRARGSEVECELRTSRPLIPSWKPAVLKIRYSLLLRKMEMEADLRGQGRWTVIDPKRPIVLDLAIPGIPLPAIDLAKDNFANTLAALERIPSDPRSEKEQIRWLFGDDPEKLLMPTGLRGFAADNGRMYIVDQDQAIYIREPNGQWHFAGTCPGWWMVARSGRLYCQRGSEISTRLADERDASWERWGDFPSLNAGERSGFLAVTDKHLIVMVHPNVACIRPLAEPDKPWVREENTNPIWPDGVVGIRDQLIAHDQRNLLLRSATDPNAKWKPIASWPEGGSFLALDGDRLLNLGNVGEIYSRPLTAGPEVGWSNAGTVHDPRKN